MTAGVGPKVVCSAKRAAGAAGMVMVPMTSAFKLFDGLAPGSGLATSTATAPTSATDAVPVAVNWVLETKVVVRFAPPKETVAPLTKLEPVMVRVKFPTFREAGEILETWGIGFQSVTALVLFTEFLEDSSASIVTKFGEGRVAGAVKFPLASITPLAALPPATPLTSQVSGLVVMEGVNCWVEPARTFAVVGEMVSVSLTGGVDPPGESAQLEVIN